MILSYCSNIDLSESRDRGLDSDAMFDRPFDSLMCYRAWNNSIKMFGLGASSPSRE